MIWYLLNFAAAELEINLSSGIAVSFFSRIIFFTENVIFSIKFNLTSNRMQTIMNIQREIPEMDLVNSLLKTVSSCFIVWIFFFVSTWTVVWTVSIYIELYTEVYIYRNYVDLFFYQLNHYPRKCTNQLYLSYCIVWFGQINNLFWDFL